jgi:hypothetical protein
MGISKRERIPMALGAVAAASITAAALMVSSANAAPPGNAAPTFKEVNTAGKEIALADFTGKTFHRIDQSIAMGALFTAHHLGAKAIVAMTDGASDTVNRDAFLADVAARSFGRDVPIHAIAFGNADEVGAAAVDYLRVVGHLVLGYFWARSAQIALAKLAEAEEEAQRPDPFYQA